MWVDDLPSAFFRHEPPHHLKVAPPDHLYTLAYSELRCPTAFSKEAMHLINVIFSYLGQP